MFYEEQPFLTEEEARIMIQEAAYDDPGTIELREKLVTPIIEVLKKPGNMRKYIAYGSEFLEANSEMLAKQFPTAYVTYPRKYVDEIMDLFGFTVSGLKSMIRDILKKYIANSNFLSTTESPTNIIHTIVLIYTDMLTDPAQARNYRNNLRDSARQQLGLTLYGLAMKHYYPSMPPDPNIMGYTYNRLDRSWDIVRDENIVNWIGEMVNTSYGFWRTTLSLNLTPKVLVNFLERVRTTIFQKMRGLATEYVKDKDAKHSIGSDVSDDDEYVEKSELLKIRNTLVRRAFGGDELYKQKGELYKGIAKWKNVKLDDLYEFSQKVTKKDMSLVVDMILYVFITKEGNSLEDINSVKYINRITKFPTAVDRAVSGKPVILPMVEQYHVNDNIVKAYICLVATYILRRINDAVQN